MTRHYRIQRPAAKDARREANLGDMRQPDPGDRREPWHLKIAGYPSIDIDWTIRPRRGNVRQWGAFDASGNPTLIDGKHLIGGKDEILRAAAKLMPSFGWMIR